MFYIYNSTPEVLENWKKEDGLLLLPSESVFTFLVNSLDKFGVLKTENSIKELIDNKHIKNISIDKVKNVLNQEEMSDVFSKPNKGQLDHLFYKTVENIGEARDIYCTTDSFALFIYWCSQGNYNFDEEIYFEGDIEAIFNAFANQMNKSISLKSLERLLKLFSMFYGKKIDRRKNKDISKFQYLLLSDNNEETIFKKAKYIKRIIEDLHKKEKENLSSCNIFNKVIEMLDTLIQLEQNYSKGGKEFIILFPKDEVKERSKTQFKNILGL